MCDTRNGWNVSPLFLEDEIVFSQGLNRDFEDITGVFQALIFLS